LYHSILRFKRPSNKQPSTAELIVSQQLINTEYPSVAGFLSIGRVEILVLTHHNPEKLEEDELADIMDGSKKLEWYLIMLAQGHHLELRPAHTINSYIKLISINYAYNIKKLIRVSNAKQNSSCRKSYIGNAIGMQSLDGHHGSSLTTIFITTTLPHPIKELQYSHNAHPDLNFGE